MECEKRHDVRRDECGPHAVAFFSVDLDTVSMDEHHHDPEVLAHVVPRTPGDINGEQPRNQPVKHMCCNQRDDQQRGEIHSYDSVPGQIFPGSICAINRSHVMGSINEDGERVETQCEGLSACGIEIGHQDKQQ